MIDSRIERAPSSEVSSSGDSTACSTASIARRSPVPMPMPSSAWPASAMIVRTSAKSRLIRPGSVIRSEMPCTPWRSTSSATRNASTIDVDLSSTDRSRAFGITISVSTSRASSSTPVGLVAAARALERERLGDDADGERAHLAGDPRDHGRRAGAGAAAGAGGDEHHVRALEVALDLVVVLDGRGPAEVRVRAGAEPARGARCRCAAAWTRDEPSSDWTSVLTATNSTPSTSASIIRLTAFTPAPPTPTTRRTGSVGRGRDADERLRLGRSGSR